MLRRFEKLFDVGRRRRRRRKGEKEREGVAGEKWNRVSQRWREGASGECRRRQSKYLVDPGILNKGQQLRSSVRSFAPSALTLAVAALKSLKSVTLSKTHRSRD